MQSPADTSIPAGSSGVPAQAGPTTGPNGEMPDEPAYYAVLRELVGAEAFALWLNGYTGDPTAAEAEAAAYAYFGLDR